MKPDGELVVAAGPQYVAVQDAATSQPTLVQIGTSQIIKQALDKLVFFFCFFFGEVDGDPYCLSFFLKCYKVRHFVI